MSLIDKAAAVRENAYAPYSKFKVGAALRATVVIHSPSPHRREWRPTFGIHPAIAFDLR